MLLKCPNEIIQAIFIHSTNDDLSQLIRVNHLIYDIAICILYRSIPRMDVEKATDCLTSLFFNDFYASLVRSLSIEWSSISLGAAIPKRSTIKSIVKYGTLRAISQRRTLQDRITLLNTSLRRLQNLTVLSLIFNPHDNLSNTYAHRILSGCSFALSKFTTSLTCSLAVIRFLEAQTGLLSLNLSGNFSMSDLGGNRLSPKSLPKLKSLGWTLGVPCGLAAHFIRGRPVQRVNVMLNSEQALEAVNVLGLSACPIDSAIFKFGEGVEVQSLPHIAARMPDLRLLKISLTTLPPRVRFSSHPFRSTPIVASYLSFLFSGDPEQHELIVRPTSQVKASHILCQETRYGRRSSKLHDGHRQEMVPCLPNSMSC